MPAKSIRVEIENHTRFELRQSDATLDSGEWTGDRLPLATIAPGTTGVIRSQTGNLFTGTVSYIKYEFRPAATDDRGNRASPEVAWVWWSVPFIGLATATADVHTGGVDIDPAEGPKPLGPGDFRHRSTRYKMELAFRSGSDGEDGLGTGVQQAVYATGPLTTPWNWVLLNQVVGSNDPHLRLALTERATNEPAAPPETVLLRERFEPVAGESHEFWARDWLAIHPSDPAKQIAVKISRSGPGYDVVVHDTIEGAPFDHKERRLLPASVPTARDFDETWTPRGRIDEAPIRRPTLAVPPAARLGGPTRAVRTAARIYVADRMFVGRTCMLQAYAEFQNEVRVRSRLRHLRWSALHHPVCDVLLLPRPGIR